MGRVHRPHDSISDYTFRQRFRVDVEDFMYVVELLRPVLERDARQGARRNSSVGVELRAAMCLRRLARGTVCELMDGQVVSKSTANYVVRRVIDSSIAQDELK